MKKSFFAIFKDPDKLIWLIVILNLIGSLIFFAMIGPAALSSSDDTGYLDGGRFFAKSGHLAVWHDVPTASVMPAMPIITGFAASIFSNDTLYIASVKLLFIAMGCFTPLFFYRAAALLMPKWIALLCSGIFLCPTYTWMNTLVLTEAPYLLFSTMCLYYTFKMGEDDSKKYLWRYIAAFFFALAFRANIVIMPVFTWIYLLLRRKYSIKELLRRLCLLALVSMIMIVPWTIRNYIIFDEFIPLTYGTHHPMWMGSYEGVGFPSDEDLDYETYADKPFFEDYAHYYNEDGSLKDPNQHFFLAHKQLKYRFDYRIQQWAENDLGSLLYSYLIYKPMSMLNWIWYWGPAESTVVSVMGIVGKLNFLLCAAAFVLSLILKKCREIVIYLGGMYVINIYILATATVTARYASMFLPLRYLISGIGIWLIVEAVKKLRSRRSTVVSA